MHVNIPVIILRAGGGGVWGGVQFLLHVTAYYHVSLHTVSANLIMDHYTVLHIINTTMITYFYIDSYYYCKHSSCSSYLPLSSPLSANVVIPGCGRRLLRCFQELAHVVTSAACCCKCCANLLQGETPNPSTAIEVVQEQDDSSNIANGLPTVTQGVQKSLGLYDPSPVVFLVLAPVC